MAAVAALQRCGVGRLDGTGERMGLQGTDRRSVPLCPIPLPASPLKGEELLWQRCPFIGIPGCFFWKSPYFKRRASDSGTYPRPLAGDASRGEMGNSRGCSVPSERFRRASRNTPGKGGERSWLSLFGVPDQAMTVWPDQERAKNGLRNFIIWLRRYGVIRWAKRHRKRS